MIDMALERVRWGDGHAAPRLTWGEQRDLVQRAPDASGPVSNRYWIVLLAEAGQGVGQIADAFQLDARVETCLQQYRARGPAGLAGRTLRSRRTEPARAPR